MSLVSSSTLCRGIGFACLLVTLATTTVACGKREPPPDPLKDARETIEKAKRVEGAVGTAADAARKSDEEQTK